MTRFDLLSGIALTLTLVGAGTAHPQTFICLTFDATVDEYQGVTTPVTHDHFSLDLVETSGVEAAWGSVKVDPNHFHLGWTKNTSCAIVGWTCKLDRATRTGPCTASVLFPELPELNELVEATGTLTVGSCPTREASAPGARTLGEPPPR